MFDFTYLLETLGDTSAFWAAGLAVGVLFGVCAQQSAFCLRAASVAFWRGQPGQSFAVWLLAFSSALLFTQFLVSGQALDPGTVRQLSTAGSMSGAIVGGAMFGVGMVLARGCASRLLVLSATGNLRALMAGLVLTLVAQASLRGVLSPMREEIGSWWIVSPDDRAMLLGLPFWLILLGAIALAVLAIVLALSSAVSFARAAFAAGVGVSVAFGWWLTAQLAAQSFEPLTVQSISFSGPSADTLMTLVNEPAFIPSFGIGLVPGVFLGSALAAIASRQFKIVDFGNHATLPRYLAGACLMGFGSMLAGGCAVGAGVTGGSVLALTAWVSLTVMWLSAGAADWVGRQWGSAAQGGGEGGQAGSEAGVAPGKPMAGARP